MGIASVGLEQRSPVTTSPVAASVHACPSSDIPLLTSLHIVQAAAETATSGLMQCWLSPEAAPIFAAWVTVLLEQVSLQLSRPLWHAAAMVTVAAGASHAVRAGQVVHSDLLTSPPHNAGVNLAASSLRWLRMTPSCIARALPAHRRACVPLSAAATMMQGFYVPTRRYTGTTAAKPADLPPGQSLEMHVDDVAIANTSAHVLIATLCGAPTPARQARTRPQPTASARTPRRVPRWRSRTPWTTACVCKASRAPKTFCFRCSSSLAADSL